MVIYVKVKARNRNKCAEESEIIVVVVVCPLGSLRSFVCSIECINIQTNGTSK